MKAIKAILVVIVLVAIGCVVASVVVSRRQAAQEAAWQKARAERQATLDRIRNQPRPARTPTLTPPVPEQMSPKSATPPAAVQLAIQAPQPPVQTDQAGVKPPASTAIKPPQAARGGKPPIQDPLARLALSCVGADPEAEGVWLDAINNPDLPANERKDLIEDLNEDGFPDPKNLTPEDLPLIVSRIGLIEAYAANAMDEVNAAAFQEAYKDLVNMYARLVQR